MPVITALGRDDPLKVKIFFLIFRRGPVFISFGIVRSVDFFGREPRKFDADGSIPTSLVSSDRLAPCGDKS